MLVLASNSPRRKQLIALGGWPFTVLAPQVDERVLPGEVPGDYVRRLAESKARAALALLQAEARCEALVVAADTAVVDRLADDAEGKARYEIMGKPADAADAERMLRQLRGRIHQVFTGLAVLRASDEYLVEQVVITDVPMRPYSDEEMWAYIASGDPLDKAGAYAIQHPGFNPVRNLHGCYANVMGLPLCHLAKSLGRSGLSPIPPVFRACQEALEIPCQVYQLALESGLSGGQPGARLSDQEKDGRA